MSDVTRVEEIYLAAIERGDSADRAAYLESACGGDADLRRRVDELLAVHSKVGPFLEPSADATQAYRVAERESAVVAVGQVIADRYKLLERIGEGGMGEVWVAEQLAPVRRRVAVKLIKPGMDSRGVLARFEAERQALAVMDHPNIARVFDAGTTADARPYFVMELVKGVPITEFCDARRLTPKERLELFVPVCQAIQHAHQKGVIHRDIKPTNVLVALHDETPVPKVIDFGVAKAVGQPLTESTIYTGFGTLVGTPAYMAPEQATFNQLDIDTRADVYALGVVLYELLAGSPPMEAERLKQAALDEVLRLVREEEPPRPSQRLSTSQTKASLAAVRGSDPARLSALMRGELDWIVMKALEKDRGRRYDTATALAKDVQRYLRGDAVEACPPTLGYRLRKAYRRNRAAVLVGMAFAVMLLTGVAAATLLAIQARRAEAVARYKEQEAQEQRKEAERLFENNSKMQEVYMEAAVEAEIRNNGSRLDSDLLEYKSDTRVGLLRLARPLKDQIGPIQMDFPLPNAQHWMGFEDDSTFVKLREFQAASVISAGQEFVPLVPPLNGSLSPDETHFEMSSDGRLCVFGVERMGLELFAIPSLNRLGTIREADERILHFGISPDSKTVWTQDTDSVVRFWNTDGTLRAKTPLRPERFVYPAGMTLSEIRSASETTNSTFVTNQIALVQSEQRIGIKPGETLGEEGPRGPIDLYDMRTGSLIRRLDWMPRRQVYMRYDWKLSPDEQWLYASQENQIVILSAIDGRELARLDHPNPREADLITMVSPSGTWLMSYRNGETDRKHGIILWNTSTWQAVSDPTLAEWIARNGVDGFLTDDILKDEGVGEVGSEGSLFGSFFHISRPGPSVSYSALGCSGVVRESPVGEHGGSVIRYQRILTDANTLQRLKPAPGRKYAAALARLAPDGRFFENLDTATEKELPTIFEGHFVPGVEGRFLPGIGRVAFRRFGGEPGAYTSLEEPYLHILPDSTRLDIPADMLELWAQVIVGGELDAAGVFHPWDHSTWSAKQRELAAMKRPYPDFPFPGWAATEPHLWYRIRANMTQNGPERETLLDEWRQRSGRTRTRLEPDPWRTPGPVHPEPAIDPAPPPGSATSRTRKDSSAGLFCKRRSYGIVFEAKATLARSLSRMS